MSGMMHDFIFLSINLEFTSAFTASPQANMKIKALRSNVDLTQEDVANALGITRLSYRQKEMGDAFGLSKQIICNYETGYRSMNASMFFAICKYLNMNPNDVAEEVEKNAEILWNTTLAFCRY